MTFEQVAYLIRRGKVGMLPNYKGYFKWDYAKDCVYMQNGDYKKYDLKDEKLRTDFYYITW
jgi:hypothetical protein